MTQDEKTVVTKDVARAKSLCISVIERYLSGGEPLTHRRHYADSFLGFTVYPWGVVELIGYAQEWYPGGMKLQDMPLVELAHLATEAANKLGVEVG